MIKIKIKDVLYYKIKYLYVIIIPICGCGENGSTLINSRLWWENFFLSLICATQRLTLVLKLKHLNIPHARTFSSICCTRSHEIAILFSMASHDIKVWDRKFFTPLMESHAHSHQRSVKCAGPTWVRSEWGMNAVNGVCHA